MKSHFFEEAESDMLDLYIYRTNALEDKINILMESLRASNEKMAHIAKTHQDFSTSKNILLEEMDKIGILAEKLSQFKSDENGIDKNIVFYSADYKAIVEHLNLIVKNAVQMIDEKNPALRLSESFKERFISLDETVTGLTEALEQAERTLRERLDFFEKKYEDIDMGLSYLSKIGNTLANISNDFANNPMFYDLLLERLAEREKKVEKIAEQQEKVFKILLNEDYGILKNFTKKEDYKKIIEELNKN